MAPRLVLCVFFVSVGSLVMSQNPTECMTKLEKCQVLLQPLSNLGNADPCSTQTPVDPCAISTKVAECLKVNLSSCMGIREVQQAVNSITATKDKSCSPGNVCQQKVSLCACHLKKIDPNVKDMNAETLSVMCAAVNDFQACIADCADNPQVQQGFAAQMQIFGSMCPKGASVRLGVSSMLTTLMAMAVLLWLRV